MGVSKACEVNCTGPIAPDILMRDNNVNWLRCQYESEKNVQAVFKKKS